MRMKRIFLNVCAPLSRAQYAPIEVRVDNEHPYESRHEQMRRDALALPTVYTCPMQGQSVDNLSLGAHSTDLDAGQAQICHNTK